MWPSGPHLTFGLLALLGVIEFLKAERDEYGQLNLIRLLNPFFCSSDCFDSWRDLLRAWEVVVVKTCML